MTVAKHAILSPSSAERWITCPGSVRLVSTAVESGLIPARESSTYAEEGTLAHELAEIELRAHFDMIDADTYLDRIYAWERYDTTPDQRAEMRRYVAQYVALVEDRLERHPDSQLLVEQRVDTGIPQCWGTADVVIVSPVHVEIIDLKYGSGVAVEAHENPQLMLYAVGALEEFGNLLGEPEDVYCSVFQPRIGDGAASTYSLTADDLRAWRDSIIPIAESALDGTGVINPTAEACRWCPVAGICRARKDKFAREDFATDPDLLGPEEIAEELERLPELRRWCNELEEAALTMAYSLGKPIPGFKVVMSGGRRSIADVEQAAKVLYEAGYDETVTTRTTMQTLGHLEKVVGKTELVDLLGDLLVKSEGRPSLVDEGDPRPVVDPNSEAQREFGDA